MGGKQHTTMHLQQGHARHLQQSERCGETQRPPLRWSGTRGSAEDAQLLQQPEQELDQPLVARRWGDCPVRLIIFAAACNACAADGFVCQHLQKGARLADVSCFSGMHIVRSCAALCRRTLMARR